MNRRTLFFSVAVLAASASLTASCGPPYAVLRAASPDPFIGRRVLMVEPVHFEGLQVGRMSEGQWLSRKTPMQVASYMNDRNVMIDAFMQALANSVPSVTILVGETPPAEALLIRPVLQFLEPGNFNGFFNLATRAQMIVQVLTPQGQIIEEVALEDIVRADIYNPSTGGRMRTAGTHLARRFGVYVRRRMMGQM